MPIKHQRTALLLGFVLLKFLLQYIIVDPLYDLQRDEYLHMDQANHLAWGYHSVPPVTSWISFLIQLLGGSVFWVRFFPALFGALTLVVVWKAVETLGGNLFALLLAGTGVLFSTLLRLNILYQPNALDVLCWTTFYWVVIRYVNSEQPKWLYIGAVVFALGFLNKYNMVFLALGLLPAVLVTKQRRILAQPALYMALLLGLLLVLPNLIWQYQRDFPVVHHLRELAEKHLVHVDLGGFLHSQLLYFIGSLFVIIAGGYALIRYAPYKQYRFFFWSFIFTLLIFIYFKAKSYYVIGLYPIYLAFGAVFLAHVLQSGWKRYLRPVLVLIPVLFFIPMYDVAFPNKSPEYIAAHPEKYRSLGMLRWEDGKEYALPQDFADMLGWRELAAKVDKAYASVPDPTRTIVLCDNYGQAGAINYYTTKGIKAVSFNADYIDWFDLDRQYIHLIRVKNPGERERELSVTSPYFQTSAIADSIANPLAREYGTTIFVFTDANIDVNARIQEEIEEVKKRY